MARLTLDVPDPVRERLERLKTKSEASSVTEVVRRALAVYELLLEADVSGGSVLIAASDGSVKQVVVR